MVGFDTSELAVITQLLMDAGLSEGEIAQRTPDDIEVMMDDDIVAKQLREAALAEDDPELRDRLWEEYRKYQGM